MAETVRAEHLRLLRQMDELKREHRQLQLDRHDRNGHEQHRDKLHSQLTELRAHMRRLRGES